MGNVVRPRGRKPAAVYWRRRIVLLAVVVGLVAVGWRWAGGGPESEPVEAAADGRATAAPSSTATPGSKQATAPQQGSDAKDAKGGKDAKPADSKPKSTEPKPKQRVSTSLEPPRGSCETADVVVIPDVADAEARGSIPVRLGLSTTGGQACTFELTAEKLALEITSGDDLIWRASTCPEVLDAKTVTLRPGWLSYVEAAWSGRRASDDCLASNEYAEPGYYWAEAAIVGGEPARGQFRLEEPPPPPEKTPQKTPQQKPQQKPDDQT